MHATAVEIRQEQDQTLDNLRKQLNNLGELLDQTDRLDDVQTLDQTYEVNQSSLILIFANSFQEFNTQLGKVRAKLNSLVSSSDQRIADNVADLQRQVITLSNRVSDLTHLRKNHTFIYSESRTTRSNPSNSGGKTNTE